MEPTPMKLPSGTYTMEGTSKNVHPGSYLMEIQLGSSFMELTPLKLPHGTYIIEVT